MTWQRSKKLAQWNGLPDFMVPEFSKRGAFKDTLSSLFLPALHPHKSDRPNAPLGLYKD